MVCQRRHHEITLIATQVVELTVNLASSGYIHSLMLQRHIYATSSIFSCNIGQFPDNGSPLFLQQKSPKLSASKCFCHCFSEMLETKPRRIALRVIAMLVLIETTIDVTKCSRTNVVFNPNTDIHPALPPASSPPRHQYSHSLKRLVMFQDKTLGRFTVRIGTLRRH